MSKMSKVNLHHKEYLGIIPHPPYPHPISLQYVAQGDNGVDIFVDMCQCPHFYPT